MNQLNQLSVDFLYQSRRRNIFSLQSAPSRNIKTDQQYGPSIHLRVVDTLRRFIHRIFLNLVLEPSMNKITVHQYFVSID